VLQTRDRAPTPSPFNVFTFGLAIESIKEFEGMSVTVESLINSNLVQCMFVIAMMEIGVLGASNYVIHPFEQHYMSLFLFGVPPI
jgi:hypothetical protein